LALLDQQSVLIAISQRPG